MKKHIIQIGNANYSLYYDRFLKLWTSYEIDEEQNQIGNTEYWITKKDALNCLQEENNLNNK